MACLDYTWAGNLLYDWQTLIAGAAAVFGGWLAYRAGINQAGETRAGAALQVQAARETAASQVEAISRQTAHGSLTQSCSAFPLAARNARQPPLNSARCWRRCCGAL